jgi:hypothetical protein
MFKKQLKLFIFVLLVLAISIQACSTPAPATPTPTAPPPTGTALPSLTPTMTAKPTSTPRPTNTPDVRITEVYEHLYSKVQMFKDESLIPATNGEYRILDAFNKSFAQIGWMSYEYSDFEVEYFVFNADVTWRTAVDNADTSGCGIVFAIEEKGKNNEYYGVILDKSRIYFTSARSGHYRELGKTRGTGRLDFGNPAEAELTILVYENLAYVYVDDNFVGEYGLSKDKAVRGKFGYGIISGTNKSYGTTCSIKNARMWEISTED